MAQIPEKFQAGLTFDALVHGTPGVSSCQLLMRGPAAVTLDGVRSGSGFKFSEPPTRTVLWPAGLYAWSLRGTYDAGRVFEIISGQITVTPDLAAMDAGYDPRSQAQRSLDNINAVLEKRATQDQAKYVIENRELWRSTPAELLRLKRHFVALVAAEQRKAAGRSAWREKRVSF